ncbi:GNAT family N-acetyltransferase [Isoptericola sp. BMS4]|uniref:GNAT family N-acetyltransferase n=1 Tax=Isoptericola sp. BMS4 TaxID=2527875 RepID=UPI00141F4D42|nr:GNAT family N-acetyltransferase [Isoptericola sp. BMS4]
MTRVDASARTVPRARTARLSALDDATVAAWRALSRRALDPNPYLDVDFLRSTHRHLAPDVDPVVVTAWDDGVMVGLLPYVESARWHGLPVRARSTAPPLGATVTDLHTPLLAPEAAVPAARALLAEATRPTHGRPAVVELAVLGTDGAVWPAVRRALDGLGATWRVWEHGERGAVGTGAADRTDLRRDDVGGPVDVPLDEVLAHLSRSRRRSVGRSAAALVEALGPLAWRDRSDDPAAVDDFVRLETSGWKGRREQGGEGVAVLDGGTAWLHEVTGRLRGTGALVVGELSAGGTPVFLGLTYAVGGHWFGARDVYADRLRRFGPGVLGRLVEAWWVRRQGVRLFDSCVNPAVYPTAAHLYPERRGIARVVAGRGPLGRTAVAGAAAVHEHRRASESARQDAPRDAGGAPAGRPS